MRKKIFVLLLCIISVLSLAGCVSVEIKDDDVEVDVGNIHIDVDDNVDVKID